MFLAMSVACGSCRGVEREEYEECDDKWSMIVLPLFEIGVISYESMTREIGKGDMRNKNI